MIKSSNCDEEEEEWKKERNPAQTFETEVAWKSRPNVARNGRRYSGAGITGASARRVAAVAAERSSDFSTMARDTTVCASRWSPMSQITFQMPQKCCTAKGLQPSMLQLVNTITCIIYWSPA